MTVNNKFKYSTISLMALLALKADAVGLGELIVHSELGEPLHAEIPLIQSSGEFQTVDQMFVDIASQEEHDKQGVDKFLARQSILLRLEENVNDDVVLKLTSKNPVNEPFLNFLLELKWQTGRLIKQYTVLLDPPGFSTADTVTSIIKPRATTTTINTVPANRASSMVRYSTSSSTPAEYKDGVYGPVRRGETLSEIAMRVRPAGYNIRLVDMMAVIQRQNPQAFINNEADLLLQGAMLEIPDVSQVLAFRSGGNSVDRQSASVQPENTLDKKQTAVTTADIQPPSSIAMEADRLRYAGLSLSMTLDESFLLASKLDQVTGASQATEVLDTTDSDISATPATVDNEVGVIEDTNSTTDTADVTEEAVFDEPEGFDEAEPLSETETAATWDEELSDDSSSEQPSTVSTTDASQTGRSLYGYLLLALAFIGAGLVGLWLFARRKTNEEFKIEPRQVSGASVKTPRFDIKSEKQKQALPKTEAEETLVKRTVDNVDSREKTNSQADSKQIDTVIMSPEESKSAGIDKLEETSSEDKHTDHASNSDGKTLVDDYLDTVEIPAGHQFTHMSSEQLSQPAADSNDDNSIDYNPDEVLDISVPLDDEDDEVNDIISELLDGDVSSVAQNSEDASDYLELEPYDSDLAASIEDTTLSQSVEQGGDDEDIEDLIVNFENNSPEREFEREVSVFMAYGDFNGAEEVIENALNKDQNNPIYKLAQLSLYKATGKFGAALILSQELSKVSDTLSEQDRKKLELLSDDLFDDDNNITVAS